MNNSSLTLEQQSMTLARLLSQRQWALLENILTSSTSAAIFIDDPTLPHAVTANIVVHFAARFQAPLRIISMLACLYPISLTSSDVTGRYPIHVAAKWSATPDVIAYLLKTNPAVAGVPDTTGKTPMHYVGECYMQHFNSSVYSRDESMLQVVRLLKGAAPLSVNLEDIDGMNAIEYALISDANLKVVKTMQRACRDDWRERSKKSLDTSDSVNCDDPALLIKTAIPMLGRRRHHDLVKEVQTSALKLQARSSRSDRYLGSKLMNDRVHVHRRASTSPNALAARTA